MIQLRVRTEFTFGQTFAPISKIIERLKAQGCRAAGIVDVNSTWGHVPWFNACRKADIQPLLGVDLVVSDDERIQRMWFLARHTEGLSELYQATSKAHRQRLATKFGSLPRLYRSDVEAMTDGIIKFSGDIMDKDWLKEIEAEIDLSPASLIVYHTKSNLAEQLCCPPVGISDNAYASPEDAEMLELCTRGAKKQTPQHLLDADELEGQARAGVLAAMCKNLELPVAPMIRAEGNLEEVCREGIRFRGMEEGWTQAYEDRLQYELELIKLKDYESYFLMVADMVHYAKEHMLVGPSRGSAAGSLVCYTSRITEVDPIPPGLFFERFIDVSRSDLPDIDLDFPDTKRQMVFDYMSEKYGEECVAHIGTISVYRPKSALIQICKAVGIPPQATGAVKVAMIERSSADSRANNCLEDTFKETEPGKEFIKMYPEAQKAQALEGHASHTGVHAAGLLVCNDDIANYATVDENGIAQVDKGSAETVGLLKIDVLGLRTLGVLEDAGVPIDWYDLKFDDPATFDVFNSGRLCGIFQFEGDSLRAVSRDIKFKEINEVDAVTALARPGPFGGGVTAKYIDRMNGEAYEPIHPLVEEHMSKTFGLPVYQEQTLAIVREIGKFDWKETSIIRKAMSKTMGKEFFDTYWERFKKGAAGQGIEEKEARATWELISTMGAWQMNKAHTYSYAVISYWTAYLKAHHPLEFAAANLRSAKDEDSAIELLREMVREGVGYTSFDIEKSQLNWSVQDGQLYGGFTALKGIGPSKAAKLIAARDEGRLTAKQRESVEKAEDVFNDIFPFQTLYGHIYADPNGNNVADDVVKIVDLNEDIPHRNERVFIAELMHKNSRNANEELLIKKRGGKMEKGQLEFVDVRLRDDTGTIGGRIGRWDFLRCGKELLENIPLGSHLLVRAAFYNGIRYAFIKKWMRLDGGDDEKS